jgi:ABC-2 type transport system permease protein
MFWAFLGPILFMGFFGLLFKGGGEPPPTTVWLYEGGGSSNLGRAVALLLGDDGAVVKAAPADTTPPEDVFLLALPAGSTDSLAAGRPPHAVLRTPNENPTPRERTVLAQATRALMNAFLGLSAADARAALDDSTLRARIGYEPRVRLAKRAIQAPAPSVGFQHTVPGYIVMFLLMTLMTSGAAVLIEERRSCQLRRALVSRLQAHELVLGKFASRIVFAWMQIVVMLGIGILAFRVRFGTHPDALGAVLFAFALSATGLGLLFATLFRHPEKAAGVGSLLAMATAALGGCWWPLEIVPGWMRQIAFLLPTGWGYDALNRVMALDAGLPQVARHVAVLLGIAAVSLPLAARRLARSAG